MRSGLGRMLFFRSMNKNNLLILVFPSLVCLVFYLKTMLPTVGFWDTGEFQTIPYTLDIGHPPGYPTYVLLGKAFLSIFPFNSVAFRMNLFSAVSVCLALFLIARTVFVLTENIIVSAFCPLILGFSRTVWEMAIRAEPHTLHLFFSSCFGFLIIQILYKKQFRLILAASFTLGISLGNHLLSIFFLPVLALCFLFTFINSGRKVLKLLTVGLLLLFFGASVYLFLPISASFRPALSIDYNVASLEGFFRVITGRDFSVGMQGWAKGAFLPTVIYYYESLTRNLNLLVVIFSLIGLAICFKRFFLFNLSLIFLFLATLFFSLRYQNAALERYFVLSFLILLIWAGVGFSVIWNFLGRRFRGAVMAIFALILFFQIRTNYTLVDQSKNYSAYNFATEALKSSEPDSVIFSWWNYSTPLWYMVKVEGVRSDVSVFNYSHVEWEDKAMNFFGKRPVYFIEQINLKQEGLALVKEGSIFKLVEKSIY